LAVAILAGVAITPDTEPWAELLELGRGDQRLVHDDFYEPRGARPVLLPDELNAAVKSALATAGIDQLYTHQAEALFKAFDGPTIVTTGTASGKSLCFQIPTLEVLTSDRAARALYLYPTKALAQDQARALHSFGLHKAIRPAIYDGDTPRAERAAIRKRSNLILTNPDMLHVGILPNHPAWGEMLANLAFVVVDEAHVYRGVFGSHVANVLRRLRRVAAIHGCEPRFLLTSATIANPVELAEGLTGIEGFNLVDHDGAPRAARRVAMWNPPLLDEELGVRASALYEAAELFSELITAGARTICFMKSRKGVELILRHSLDRLDPELGERIAPYRGGYTPQQRQDIQRRLSAGELLGVVATDALELGSTSASSTRRSASPSREPSPASGRCGDGRAGADGASPCTWPARTRSTSSSAATPRSSWADRSRRRSSIRTALRSSPSI
jgi:DEAD/DEAH box helicase domain-containing protein